MTDALEPRVGAAEAISPDPGVKRGTEERGGWIAAWVAGRKGDLSGRTFRTLVLTGFTVCLVLISGLWFITRSTAVGLPTPAVPPKGHYDYAGLIHLHSDYSEDASASYASLARTAADQGINFLIVTDHNTLEPIRAGEEGWRDGVLVLTGAESSLPEGQLLEMNVPSTLMDGSETTEDLLDAVARDGGLALIAHPAHRKWGWKGPVDDRIGGMEILDLADQFYAAPIRSKLTALALLPFNRMRAYLELGTENAPTLRIWDTMTQRRRFVGVYAPDIHQSIELWAGKRWSFPPAAEIMRIARNHIVSDEPMSGDFEADRALVYGALRDGHLFVSLDVLADATGFMFAGEHGATKVVMGDELIAEPDTRYSVTLPSTAAALNAVTRVLRNGVVVATSQPGALTYTYEDDRPGVYRIESVVMISTAFGADREVTWIYSNPIYSGLHS
ncbi:MAG: hypothetical protein ACOH1H_08975 [Brevundimonas sp.]